jgi:DNA polymerase-3 subunit alpha
MISKINYKMTKNSNEMAFVTIEDMYNELEIIVFPKTYYRIKNILKVNNPIIVKGKINFEDTGTPKIIALKIEKITDELIEKMKNNNRKLYLKIEKYNKNDINLIKSVLINNRGNENVILYFEDLNKKLILDSKYFISYSEKLKWDLEKIIGKDSVKYC